MSRDPAAGDGVLLKMTGIVKDFPGVRALGGVDRAAHLDAVADGGDDRAAVEQVVEVVALDEVEATDLLGRLGERAVGDDGAARPDRLGLGAVVQLGRQHGIATPANEVLTALIQHREQLAAAQPERNPS